MSDKTTTPCPLAQEGPSWLLGHLSSEEAVAFERHLANCPGCTTRLAEYRKISDGLRAMPPVPLGSDLAPLVLGRLAKSAWKDPDKADRPVVRRRHLIAFEALAAAVLLTVGAAVFVLPRLAHPPSPDASVASSPVPSALHWLSRAQDVSGAWKPGAFGGSDGQTLGVTALVVYSFLKHPELAKEHYAETVQRGVRYLVRNERPDGFIGTSRSGYPTRDQGLATLALVRAAVVWGEPDVRRAADAAVARIRETQASDGSWGHPASARAAPDVSVTVWHLHALVEAETGGWKGLGPSIERGLTWLRQARLAEGRSAYARPGSFPYGMASASDAGRLFLLADTRGGSKEAKRLPLDDPLRVYFVTRGLGALDDASASRWVRTLRDDMAGRQVRTGNETGSWDASDPAGGRVSSTAFAALAFD